MVSIRKVLYIDGDWSMQHVYRMVQNRRVLCIDGDRSMRHVYMMVAGLKVLHIDGDRSMRHTVFSRVLCTLLIKNEPKISIYAVSTSTKVYKKCQVKKLN